VNHKKKKEKGTVEVGIDLWFKVVVAGLSDWGARKVKRQSPSRLSMALLFTPVQGKGEVITFGFR